jgi:hypothetical protein
MMVLSLIGILSCSPGFDEPVESRKSEVDPPKTAYGKMAYLMSDTANEAVDTIGKYVDLDSIDARSLEEDGLESLGQLLPDDFTMLKRKIGPGEDRVLEAGTEVTLDQELKEIKKEFDATLEKIMPDPTPAKTLPEVEIDKENIKVSGDVSVPLKSPTGVATIEVMNAVANGEDPEKKINEMQKDIALLADGQGTSTERGLYMHRPWTWPSNTVRYIWEPGNGKMSDLHKEAMRTAMDTWHKKTGGRVRFQQFASNPWTTFLDSIFGLNVVMYADSNLGDSTNGDALMVPYKGWSVGRLRLKRYLTDPVELRRTSLHELGHVLGLEHEQKRDDRDHYVIVTEGGINHSKIKEFRSDFRFCSRTVKIWRWRYTIWYPCFWKSRNSDMTGPFDFYSIMLYSNLQIRDPNHFVDGVHDPSSNTFRTRLNTDLSATDIETILRLY